MFELYASPRGDIGADGISIKTLPAVFPTAQKAKQAFTTKYRWGAIWSTDYGGFVAIYENDKWTYTEGWIWDQD